MFANGTKRYLFYKNFEVGPPSSQYQLIISGYSGSRYTCTHDPIIQTANWGSNTIFNGMKFTTGDRNNNACFINCALTWGDFNGGIGIAVYLFIYLLSAILLGTCIIQWQAQDLPQWEVERTTYHLLK